MGHSSTATKMNLLCEILASPLLHPTDKKTYEAVYGYSGPITGAEIREAIGEMNPHGRLNNLAKHGVVRKDGKKFCRFTNKLVQAWVITGQVPTEPQKPKYTPPTINDINVFLRDITILKALAYDNGARISPEVRRVTKWLSLGAPCHHELTAKTTKKALK